MAFKYNPLLKIGLENTGNGSIEAEIDDLRQHKVTKCLTAADLLNVEEGEIIQWQGNTQTIDNVQFINGYFYICNGETVTVQPPVNYLNFTTDFPLNHEYNLNDYNFTFGKYYKVKSLNIDVSNIKTYSYLDTNSQYRFLALKPIVLNTIVFDRLLNMFETVINIDDVNLQATTNNNQIIDISGISIGTMQTFWHTGNADGSKTFYILEPNSYMNYLLVDWDFETNTLKAWFPFQCLRQTQNTPYNYNTQAFRQTDTQPGVSGISNDEGGGVAISTDVTIAGNLTVQGTQTVVQTQEIDSESDNINLRYNNPLALADGEESGVKVLNYDGNNTNCFLGVDNQGWARVGDEGGNLQKLATIEDTPTDGALVAYNTANKQLESKTIPAATQSVSGLMSATDKAKLDGIAAGAQVNPGAATQSAAGLMSASDKKKLDGIAAGAEVNPSLSTTTQSGIQLAKFGRLCFLNGSLNYSSSITLPAAYKPSNWIYFNGVGAASSTSIFIAKGTINANGVLTFGQPVVAISGSTISFNPSSGFPVAFSVAYIAAS